MPQRIQQALKESGNYYQMFFDDSPIPSWIFDGESLRFVDVNKATVAKYGYSREEFLGMTIVDIRPDEDKARLIQHMEEQNKNNGTIDNNWRHKKKDGTVFFVDVQYQLITLAGRNTFIVQCTDINDKVLAERENCKLARRIEQQKEQLDDILSIVNEVVWSTRLDTSELLYTNNACYDVYGYTPAEMMADKDIFLKSIHPEDMAQFQASVEEAKIKGRSQEHFRVRHKNGTIRYLAGTAVLKKGENGRPDILRGITVDITKLRAAEWSLKEKIHELEEIQALVQCEQQNLSSVINNTKDMIWAVDAEYKLTIANEPFRQLMFQKFGAIIENGMNIHSWDMYTDKAAYWASLYRKAFNGEHFTIVDEEKVNGESYYARINFNPIRDEHGKVTGVSCFATDVTEQRKQLIHMQLQNERLKEIAWIQSHKVRGPVASILGLAQLFNYENAADPMNTEILEGFKQATDTLDEVIKEINGKAQVYA